LGLLPNFARDGTDSLRPLSSPVSFILTVVVVSRLINGLADFSRPHSVPPFAAEKPPPFFRITEKVGLVTGAGPPSLFSVFMRLKLLLKVLNQPRPRKAFRRRFRRETSPGDPFARAAPAVSPLSKFFSLAAGRLFLIKPFLMMFVRMPLSLPDKPAEAHPAMRYEVPAPISPLPAEIYRRSPFKQEVSPDP